jgi:medium-chain acyl-[acyl-carrier-protein] hydrolase
MHVQLNSAEKRPNGWPWIPRQKLRPDAALRLFLLPPAGGSSLMFQGWKTAMPAGVDVYPIQLPGRGARAHEPLLTSLEPMVQGLGEALQPFLDRPFAFFGHSMGALVAFELSRFLRKVHGVEPVLLFASGGRAPHIPEGRRDYLLPDPEFVAMLRDLNGTPKEILEDPEALRMLLPMVKADFEVIQTYEYRHEPQLSSRIRVFGGTRDSTTGEELLLPWRKHTTGSFSLSMLPGSHFFIEESRAQLLAIIAHELRRFLDQIQATHRET